MQSVFIELYYILIALASLKSAKAKKWITGRKSPPKNHNGLNNTTLIHCASYGEYEQAYPFIQVYRQNFPDRSILLSFFSPSGYEKIPTPDFVDQKIYLPRDRKADVHQLLSEFDIQKVFLVKYELWPVFIRECLKSKVELNLISCRFSRKHHLFHFAFNRLKKHVQLFKHIFVIDKESKDILLENGFQNAHHTGDTRFDKIMLNANFTPDFDLSSSTVKTILLGSIWKSDWEVIKPRLVDLGKSYRLIFAPHEVNKESIAFFEKELKQLSFSYNLWSKTKTPGHHLLVDTIGDLKYLYRFCDLAYIGGGYGSGLHNILEAMAYQKPCLIGPKFQKFPEVINAVDKNLAIVLDENNLEKQINRLLEVPKKEISQFILEHTGASERIIESLKNN